MAFLGGQAGVAVLLLLPHLVVHPARTGWPTDLAKRRSGAVVPVRNLLDHLGF